MSVVNADTVFQAVTSKFWKMEYHSPMWYLAPVIQPPTWEALMLDLKQNLGMPTPNYWIKVVICVPICITVQENVAVTLVIMWSTCMMIYTMTSNIPLTSRSLSNKFAVVWFRLQSNLATSSTQMVIVLWCKCLKYVCFGWANGLDILSDVSSVCRH